MIVVFGFLILALLIKDTVPIGDVYVLRSLSQGIALLVGLWWFMTRGTAEAIRRYWLIGAYIGVLAWTALVSSDPMRVTLQVFSLLAVSLFFISFAEWATLEPAAHQAALRVALYALLAVCLGSLALYKVSPALAYDQTVERLTWDNAHRFKGLFGKPSGVAAAAGILLGLCAFTPANRIIRGVGAVAASLCLYLTLSRSFWIGSIVALIITAVFYVRQKRWLIVEGR
ncbi:MAG: hypothetical protein U0231_15995 [Nitrospiraceae bacterium]